MANCNHKPLPRIADADIERFLAFVRRGEPDECWPWRGGLSPTGYGNFWLGGKTVSAHRVAFFVHHGYDAFPQIVLHSCDNRACCNGRHLSAGSHQQNQIDAYWRTIRPERKIELTPRAAKHTDTAPAVLPLKILPSTPEEWRPVVGHEGLYEVSSHGRVRSMGTFKKSQKGMVLRGSVLSNGYPVICLSRLGVPKNHTRHRLVAAAFIGPSSLFVNHKDGRRDNPVIDNLEYVTHAENCRHAAEILGTTLKGTRNARYTNPESSPRGSRHGMAKLTEDDVREIKRLYSTKSVSTTQLAREYDVRQTTIYMITSGRTWKHVG